MHNPSISEYDYLTKIFPIDPILKYKLDYDSIYFPILRERILIDYYFDLFQDKKKEKAYPVRYLIEILSYYIILLYMF